MSTTDSKVKTNSELPERSDQPAKQRPEWLEDLIAYPVALAKVFGGCARGNEAGRLAFAQRCVEHHAGRYHDDDSFRGVSVACGQRLRTRGVIGFEDVHALRAR